jgi:phage baseplate assembly protein W
MLRINAGQRVFRRRYGSSLSRKEVMDIESMVSIM